MTPAEPLLLLPGILCDADLWRDQIAAFGEARACSVPTLTQPTIEEMAEDVLRTAPPAFALAGLSMGGYVALAIARRAPARVTRLFLASTSARPDTAEQIAARQATIAAVDAGGFDEVAARLLRVLVHPSRRDDPTVTDRVAAMLHRVGATVFVQQQRAVAARPDARGGLAALAMPVHVLGGDGDRVIAPELTIEIARLVPHAAFTAVAQCGHLPTIEQPTAVVAAMQRWLDGA